MNQCSQAFSTFCVVNWIIRKLFESTFISITTKHIKTTLIKICIVFCFWNVVNYWVKFVSRIMYVKLFVMNMCVLLMRHKDQEVVSSDSSVEMLGLRFYNKILYLSQQSFIARSWCWWLVEITCCRDERVQSEQTQWWSEWWHWPQWSRSWSSPQHLPHQRQWLQVYISYHISRVQGPCMGQITIDSASSQKSLACGASVA